MEQCDAKKDPSRMHRSYLELLDPYFPGSPPWSILFSPTCRPTPAPSAPWSDDFGLRAAPSDLHIYQAMDIRASGGNLQGQLEAPVLVTVVTDWRVPKDPKDQSFQWRNRETSEEIDQPNPSKGSQFAKPTTTTRVYCCGSQQKNQNRPPISLDFIRWDLPSGWTWLRTVALGLWRYSDLRLFIWHVTSNEHPR